MTEKKKLFRNKILKELYFKDNLSCVELSIRIDKSFPVTAMLIEELIAANKVIETGHAASTGGRRALTYGLQKNVMYLVAVAMDQFVTKIAIMDMENNFVNPIQKIVLPLSADSQPLQVLVNKLPALLNHLVFLRKNLLGLVLGCRVLWM